MTTTTKERPILFSAPMVRAIIEGRKTQTRRIVKRTKNPECDTLMRRPQAFGEGTEFFMDMAYPTGPYLQCNCPHGVPGDRLWVRETWQYGPDVTPGMMVEGRMSRRHIVYAATVEDGYHPPSWRPSIHMPRWACRITLEIISVRIERVQDIGTADALAEGMTPTWNGESEPGVKCPDEQQQFEDLWCDIHGEASWDANPWVWVIEFRRIDK